MRIDNNGLVTTRNSINIVDVANAQFLATYTTDQHSVTNRGNVRFGRQEFDFLGMECRVTNDLAQSPNERSNQGHLLFYTWGNNVGNSTERMRIRSDGFVGIATTQPTQRLDVNGNARIQGSLFIGTSTNTQNAIHFAGTPGDAGVPYSSIINRNYDSNNGSNQCNDCSELLLIQMNDHTAEGPDRIRHVAAAHKWQVYNSSRNAVDTNVFYADSNYTDAMYINSIGNIGIGTTTPAYRLHVLGNMGVNNFIQFPNADAGKRIVFWENGSAYNGFGKDANAITYALNTTADHHKFIAFTNTAGACNELMRITGGGNVGIGIISPVERLEANGKIYTNTQFLSTSNDSVTVPSYSFREDSNTGMYHPANDTLGFVTNGTEKMRVDSTGNIGVGTTSPSYRSSK
jgi:hypothetical protein